MIMVCPKTSRAGVDGYLILKHMFRFAVCVVPAAAGALSAAQAQAQAQAQTQAHGQAQAKALPGAKRG
jgi:hypothetical protein